MNKFYAASLCLSLVAGGVAEGAVPKRRVARQTAPAQAAQPEMVATPATAEFVDPSLIEPDVQSRLGAACPSTLIVPAVEGAGVLLVQFDEAFRNSLGLQTDARTMQVTLEAYRRCIDRAITEIQQRPRYTLQDPSPEPSCLKCRIDLSEIALEVPRLRAVKALTYLSPQRLADQDPAGAVQLMRQAAEDFNTIQREFRGAAEEIIDEREDHVRERRRAAAKRANNQAVAATLGGLAGYGLGRAMGLDSSTAANIASENMQSTYENIQTELATQLESVAQQQRTIDTVQNAMFRAPSVGRWADDGIRVTVPRLAPVERDGDEASDAASTGALSNTVPLRFLVQLSIQIDATSGASCTGSFVAPRLVLTNRHCVEDKASGQLRSPGAITVLWKRYVANTNGVTPDPLRLGVAEIVTSQVPSWSDVRDDWAFLVMSEAWEGGVMELVDPSEVARRTELRVAVAGYSADLNGGEEITMDWGCQAQVRDEKIVHGCRLFNGASGSPIVAVDGSFGSTRVIGVHSSVLLPSGVVAGTVTGAPDGYAGHKKLGSASREMFATYEQLKARYPVP